jgi:1-acyl-sn-glycerol-3-phosphate acyltransferase
MIDRALSGLTRLLTGAMPLWKGCGPESKPRIYFANHTSHLDALVLWACLPSPLRAVTRPVAARDFWTAGRWRQFIAERVFHAVLIDRQRPTRQDNPVDAMLSALGEAGSLIIFPEGGRHSGADPVEFKSGLFHLARKRPDAELVPVLLDNLNRILPKGEILPLPLICSVTFGAPLRLEADESRDAFLSRARQAVIDLRESGSRR